MKKKRNTTRRGYAKLDHASFSSRRVGMGHSLAELAKVLGVSTSTVHAWEAGRASPHPCHVPKIVEIMGKEVFR